MTVGTIVKLKIICLGNSIGTLGVGFNDYMTGVQFIFENGEYDGFSIMEQKAFLEEIGFSKELSTYKFNNVIQVSRDFHNGVFDVAFKNDNNHR